MSEEPRPATDAAEVIPAEADTQVAEPAPEPTRRWVSPFWVAVALLALLALLTAGWLGWQLVGTNLIAKGQLADELTALRSQWDQAAADAEASPAGKPEPGKAAWILRIPALGDDWEWPIVAGVAEQDLQHGVGWYPETALPGQVGNFAVAGHRIGHGEPFRRMLELQRGDQIIVETRAARYIYELTLAPAELTVQETDGWVLEPVPGAPGQPPGKALLTLTTAEDLIATPDRSVAFGELVRAEPK
ncbi:MAG: class E sortase [Arachnia propionica]|nr:MAG: class E sortase [Arachnia propionica]